MVFTRKTGPSHFYQSFIARSIKLDIRRLRPSDVISIALSPDRQDQQNVRKLKGMNDSDWRALVDAIYAYKNAADATLIKRLLRLEDHQEAEMVAARANMTQIVNMLHDPGNQMMDMLLAALKEGKIWVVDVSLMRETPALVLSGLILQRIFDHNQNEFTKAEPETIPTVAVVEEAQSVLGSSGSSGEGPYVTWVKEGRKYDLGAVLITQQPGSITHEILSQGDNWFIFHLLSAGDLYAVKKANAHFSDDLLGALLNEPIPGHGVFWSSAGGKTYPVPIRVLSFEQMVKPRDPEYRLPLGKTFASELRRRFEEAVSVSRSMAAEGDGQGVRADPVVVGRDVSSSLFAPVEPEVPVEDQPEDVYEMHVKGAIMRGSQDQKLMKRIQEEGVPWRAITVALENTLLDVMSDRSQVAYDSVRRFMDEVFGKDGWTKEQRDSKSEAGKRVWYVRKKP